MAQSDDPHGTDNRAELLRLRAARDAALQAAQAAMRDTTRLTRLLTILSDPAPLEQLLDRALSALSELFSADIVILLDPAGNGTMCPLAAIGLPEELVRLPISAGRNSHVSAAMRTGEPVLTMDAGNDPELDAHLRELGVETAVWVPVIGSQAARGVLILARCRAAPFAHADADLLKAMAYRIGLALDQAQRSAQLEKTVRATREFGGHLDESTVGKEAVRMFPEVVGADATALVLTDPEGSAHCIAEQGLDPPQSFPWCRLAEYLIANFFPVNSGPFSTHDVRAVAEHVSWENCPIRTLLALPIRREERIHGLLFATRYSNSCFSPDTVRVAMLYAGQTAAALENARLYRVVRDELAERIRAEQELRESEERLKLALMGADLGMWDWNVVTGEVKCNARWEEMLGYSPEESEPGVRTWEKLIHPEDLPRVREVLDSHLEGKTPHYETEHRVYTKSGEWIWVLQKGKVTHRDDQARPLRVVGTYLDITEAKQLQAERLLFEKQKHQVWRAESLRRMAGGIAHHFNNLLGAVIGNLELALDDLPSGEEDLRSYMDEAMDASQRAAEISQLMVAYLGKTTGNTEPLDLAQALREAFRLLITSIPKNIRFSSALSASGPVIYADGVHVNQILTNLVSNAVEAIGEGEGEIVVALGETAAEDILASRFFPSDWSPKSLRYACLSVSDNGCGLEPAIQEKIFDPFFSTKFTGRGLGLSVVLGLVRAHGGAITVDSRVGSGTTFHVFFPRKVEEVRPVPASAGMDGGGLVLVVDDEPVIRRVAEAQLKRLGYEVITAVDGVEAVELFRARMDEFRLVLLDLTMPRMDGWATLAALRALRPGIPVILASGFDEAQVMQTEHPERPQAFLHKPFSLKGLKAALSDVRSAGRT